MGCFDTINIRCPKCKVKIKEQSKADKCNLLNYSYQRVPLAIAADLDETIITCTCGYQFKLSCKFKYVSMDIIDLDLEDDADAEENLF